MSNQTPPQPPENQNPGWAGPPPGTAPGWGADTNANPYQPQEPVVAPYPSAPPPLGYPTMPGPTPGAERTSMPAVSLVLSLCGLLFSPLALAGIVVGFIGRSKARKTGQPTGLATAGIIVGFVVFILTVLATIFMFTFLYKAVEMQSKTQAAGQGTSAAIADANKWYLANGSYSGWSPTPQPGAPDLITSDDSSSIYVCVQSEVGYTFVHSSATAGVADTFNNTTASTPSKTSTWDLGLCPPKLNLRR